MRVTNKLGLPQALVDAVSVDNYSRGSAHISVTQLIDPPRKVTLLREHGEELEEDASDRIYALLGTAIHHILELAGQADVSTLTEQRYFMQVPGPLGMFTISGAMDSIELDADGAGGVVIKDWKTAKVNEMVFGVKADRERQLNVYKVLLELHGYHVVGLQDIFILRDWSKVRASSESTPSLTGVRTSDYPESQVVIHNVRIWSAEEAQAYILERVRVHQEAWAAYAVEHSQEVLEDCTDEERWADAPKFAIMEPGAKRATRVLDTLEDAERYLTEHAAPFEQYETMQKDGKVKVFKVGAQRASKVLATPEEADAWVEAQRGAPSLSIVERPSRNIRCEFYCAAAPICAQWRQIQEESNA